MKKRINFENKNIGLRVRNFNFISNCGFFKAITHLWVDAPNTSLALSFHEIREFNLNLKSLLLHKLNRNNQKIQINVKTHSTMHFY